MDGEQAARSVLECCTLHGVVETGKELEKGPHADVVELKYMGLRCAGKKFRRSVEEDKNKDLLRRCKEECKVLLKLRHPNIVQFIGVYFQQESVDVPVFVTELLPLSLANCLERYGLLPEGMSYTILQDVALGLEYLHGQLPPVVHRNVCASSVLLTRDMSAKLADVGVASIMDEDGVSAEAFAQSAARYDRKADVFAYGVLTIHVLSGRLPISDLPVRVNGSLIERSGKQQYLSRVKDDHPLKDMIFQCLSNNPMYRPTITEVHRRIGSIASQFPTTFANSLEMLQKINTDATVQRELRMQVQNLSTQDSPDSLPMTEMEKLRQKLAKLSAQNVALRASLSRKCPTAVEKRIRFLEVNSEKQQEVYSPVQLRQSKLKWTKCSDMPVGMFQAQGVVIDGKVYIGGGGTDNTASDFIVFEYDPIEDSWAPLPPLPVSWFGVGQLSGELVAVGGKHGVNASDSVRVFDRVINQWKESIPPLCSPRYAATVVSYQSLLLVCGGLCNASTGGVDIVPTVEALTVYDFRWYIASHLPYLARSCLSSSIAIRDMFYLVGGYQSTAASSAVGVSHCTPLSFLLSSGIITPCIWKAMADTPHIQTTAAYLGGCLLALGGTEEAYTLPAYRSIHAYSSETNTWVYIGDLPYACCHCTAVSLPSGELLVLGGWVQPGWQKRSSCVYRATLHCS